MSRAFEAPLDTFFRNWPDDLLKDFPYIFCRTFFTKIKGSGLLKHSLTQVQKGIKLLHYAQIQINK
jgi:hypothetical protein